MKRKQPQRIGGRSCKLLPPIFFMAIESLGSALSIVELSIMEENGRLPGFTAIAKWWIMK